MKKAPVKSYTVEMQQLYLGFLMADVDIFARCNSIIQPQYFDASLRNAVRFIQEHVVEYSTLPTFAMIEASTMVKILAVDKSEVEKHSKWFMKDFETFCRHMALDIAILDSSDYLAKGEYGAVEAMIKKAMEVSLTKNIGTDYFENPEERIKAILEKRSMITTGWATIDAELYGGFERGTLNIFTGGSGAGKSVFLQNLARNWAEIGLNVIYVSLELSENLCAMRIDAMNTGMSTRDIIKNAHNTAVAVKAQSKTAGKLQIVQMPNNCTVNDLKAYVREYQIQKGVNVDAVLVDYLDLMMPAQKKVPPSDLFIKDKFVSEELRNFAVEGDFYFATASQLNRGAVDAQEFDHSHIAGGLSKIQTADNVIGIFNTPSLRERGMIEIQFMKTRSSAGVGKRVQLAQNILTLRISDLDPSQSAQQSPSSMMEKIKNRGSGNAEPSFKPTFTPKAPTMPSNVPTAMSGKLASIFNKVQQADDD